MNKHKLSFDSFSNEKLSLEEIEFLDNNYWKSKSVITDEVELLVKELITNNMDNKSMNTKDGNEEN